VRTNFLMRQSVWCSTQWLTDDQCCEHDAQVGPQWIHGCGDRSGGKSESDGMDLNDPSCRRLEKDALPGRDPQNLQAPVMGKTVVADLLFVTAGPSVVVHDYDAKWR
jgi:hypothetical protein